MPSITEYNLLSKNILDFVALIMDLESKKKLPSYAAAKNAISNEKTAREWVWGAAEISTAYGAKRRISEEEMEVFRLETKNSPHFVTNYDANNSVLDVPLKQDLATDQALDTLLEYAESLTDRCLEHESEEWEDVEQFDPIMNDMSSFLCGDGNPVWGITKQLRKNPAKYKRRMKAFFGGFHLVLEAHKKRGKMFGDTHLRDFFKKWRKTEGQLEWVMDPGDPNQVEEELEMYYLGEY